MRGGTRVVTVEAEGGLVESRLVAGRVVCSGCQSRLRPWGWARPREIFGLTGVLRPRRARCAGCLVTHVLLPVTVLLRRAYAVELIGAAFVARAAGWGHRRIAERIEVPAATARGWLRVLGSRLEPVRIWLGQVTRRAGVDQPVPKALGSPWADLLAALRAAKTAVTGWFGVLGVLGPVTVWQLAGACSAGRLLSPGWPPGRWVGHTTPVAPDVG